jgi:hypothetical protein
MAISTKTMLLGCYYRSASAFPFIVIVGNPTLSIAERIWVARVFPSTFKFHRYLTLFNKIKNL